MKLKTMTYLLLLWDLKFRAFCIDYKNDSVKFDAKKQKQQSLLPKFKRFYRRCPAQSGPHPRTSSNFYRQQGTITVEMD